MHVGIPRQTERRRTRGCGGRTLLCGSLVLGDAGDDPDDHTAGLTRDERWRNRRHKRVHGV